MSYSVTKFLCILLVTIFVSSGLLTPLWAATSTDLAALTGVDFDLEDTEQPPAEETADNDSEDADDEIILTDCVSVFSFNQATHIRIVSTLQPKSNFSIWIPPESSLI